MHNFYNDEGILYPIYQSARGRDSSDSKTFVYKFAVNSWYTDIDSWVIAYNNDNFIV